MFIVMEYIEGKELQDIVDATDYATQITTGLQAAHKKK